MSALDILLKESEAYSSFELIENALESEAALTHYPVQPLYLSLRTLSAGRVGEILPRLSNEQRQAFCDLDLWQKDDVDVDSFNFWVESYAGCAHEEIRREFAKSSDFLLYLKNRFNIWTFDVEDPEYPDHDNYFLTDDNLLLLEFHDDFTLVDEVRALVRELYAEMGVEGAYTTLFKIVSEGALSIAEEEYRLKKERLRDFGFVDYYEALEFTSPFPKLEVLRSYLQKKLAVTPTLDESALKQALHHSAVASYKGKIDPLSREMDKVKERSRLDFLNFNFIRLVNATVEIDGALKEGTVAMGRVGAKTRQRLLLGLSYLESFVREMSLELGSENVILSRFDFTDLYRVGHTLIATLQRPLKRELTRFGLDDEAAEGFLGTTWNDLLDLIFNETIKARLEAGVGGGSKDIETYVDFIELEKEAKTMLLSLPFARGFYHEMTQLKNEGRLQSSYYINYDVEDIDYEAILLSSFGAHYVGALQEGSVSGKLGLTMSEFALFIAKIMNDDQELVPFAELSRAIHSFLERYGLGGVAGKDIYLYQLLKNQLEGYDYQNMGDDEFRHVGGPILLHAKN